MNLSPQKQELQPSPPIVKHHHCTPLYPQQTLESPYQTILSSTLYLATAKREHRRAIQPGNQEMSRGRCARPFIFRSARYTGMEIKASRRAPI